MANSNADTARSSQRNLLEGGVGSRQAPASALSFEVVIETQICRTKRGDTFIIARERAVRRVRLDIEHLVARSRQKQGVPAAMEEWDRLLAEKRKAETQSSPAA